MPRDDAATRIDPLKPRAQHTALRLIRSSWLLAGLFTLAWSAWGAKWDIVPALSVLETYTDNVSLLPDAAKDSDWVTQVIPAISISAIGDRLRFSASYKPEAVYYANGTAENQIFQRGSAAGTAELAQDLFFIDVGANVDQYTV